MEGEVRLGLCLKGDFANLIFLLYSRVIMDFEVELARRRADELDNVYQAIEIYVMNALLMSIIATLSNFIGLVTLARY